MPTIAELTKTASTAEESTAALGAILERVEGRESQQLTEMRILSKVAQEESDARLLDYYAKLAEEEAAGTAEKCEECGKAPCECKKAPPPAEKDKAEESASAEKQAAFRELVGNPEMQEFAMLKFAEGCARADAFLEGLGPEAAQAFLASLPVQAPAPE